MAQPACIARHDVEISCMAAFLRTRNDSLDGVETDAMVLMEPEEAELLAVSGRERPSLSGVAWLKRLFGKT